MNQQMNLFLCGGNKEYCGKYFVGDLISRNRDCAISELSM